MVDTLRQVSIVVLVGSMVLVWLAIAIVALRWQLVLAAGRHYISFATLLHSTHIGFFFNQAMPGSVGGDVMRVWHMGQSGVAMPWALGSVFIERFIGVMTTGVICAVAVLFEWSVIVKSNLFWAIMLSLIVISIASLCFFSLVWIPESWWKKSILKKFNYLQDLIRSTFGSKIVFCKVFILSIFNQSAFIAMIYMLAQAMDISLSWGQVFLIVPIIFLVASVPVSFAGWGIREGAVVLTLAVYGVGAEAALSLSILFGFLQLAASIPGLVLWLFDKKEKRILLAQRGSS